MSLDTFNPPVAPSPGTMRKPEVKLLKATFGDGYTQAARDGLNAIQQVYELRWDVLTRGQADAIETFLEARAGTTPFLYQHPGTPAAIKMTCDEWSREEAANRLCAFRATLRQSFVPVS